MVDIQSRQFSSFVDVGPGKSARLVNDITMASNALSVLAETVSFSAGAAGTSGVVGFDKAPIYDATGTRLGAKGATSFAWVTGTVLTTEVALDLETYPTETLLLASLAQGEYAIDYVLGKLYYKKATAGTSDTCNYTTRQLNVQITTAAVSLADPAVPLYDGAVLGAARTIKATPGTLYYLSVYNPNASDMFLQVFDHAAPTVGVTTAKLSLWVPAQGGYDVPMPVQGFTFATAITMAATTTFSGAGAPGSALLVNAAYK